MSLRFFRRKSSSSDDESNDKENPGKDNPAGEEKKPARRGRRGGAGRSKTTTKAAAEKAAPKEEAEEEAKPASSSGSATARSSSGRTRRGRRGGAGRKKPAPKAEAATTAAESTTEAPAEGEHVVSELRDVQGSLSAIENRLAGIERLGPGAERPRLGIFVDVPNIMYAAERLRARLDFGKVLQFITNGRELVRASAYAPISDDPEERLESQKFVQPFMDHGYRIVTKPLKRYADGSIKANFDVELAIDVMTMSDRLDIVVLMSGDGDFRRLVELVESKGVRVEVVAFGQSTASELRTVADVFVDLSEHLKDLRVS